MIHDFFHSILYFYGYGIYFYSLALILIYILLIVLAHVYSRNYSRWTNEYIQRMVEDSPYVPEVTVVAGASGEGDTIEANVRSLLKLKYPNYKICIVANPKEGDTNDKTLEVLIEKFDLVKVEFDYVEDIHNAEFKGMYISMNPAYAKLTVLHKKSGGTKADAINGGLNVIQSPYIINTDADCILSEDAIYQCIFPVLQDSSIIAVSGTMSINNGFKWDKTDKTILERKVPKVLKNLWLPLLNIPLYQDMEYKRSFLVGKMGWSQMNAMNNVSGGYGLFNTEIIKAAGGYGKSSKAEDMDMLTRMVAYCCETGRNYKVVQIPHTCCWTQATPNIEALYKQRKRWGYGLLQVMWDHKRMLFNPKYKRMGMISFVNTFLFEMLAPVIEVVGYIIFIYLWVTRKVNWDTFILVTASIYFFSLLLNMCVLVFDYAQGGSYDRHLRNYAKLMLAAALEPIPILGYHFWVMLCTLKGYFNFLTGKGLNWDKIERQQY